MTFFGQNSISDLRLGDSQVKAAYLGNMKLWPEEQPTAGYWGLCFTAEEHGATVSMIKTGTPPSVSLLYSTDSSTWNTFTVGETTVTLANAGDKVWLKAGPGGNTRFASNTSNYTKFVTSKANASGSIMSLLDGEQQQTSLSEAYCFNYLFSGSSTKTAPELPATTLTSNCYRNMFQGCTSLTSAPALPATTLFGGCYNSMFSNCTSLTQAPALPAQILADSCYQYMFQNCSSLATAPALPATTLANYCYSNMFKGCTSLTQAPALPAQILANNCYNSMFNNCTSLTQAPALPAEILDDSCYAFMFRGCNKLASISASFTEWSPSFATTGWVIDVSSSGTFYCPTALGTNETITRGNNNCPTNWTVVNTDA